MLTTYTGRNFDYNNITKESINIEDIFLSLPRLNRFVGHSSRAYSVGEHTYFCLMMAKKLGYTQREQFLTFIHDFTEAYVGDCPSPLKRLIPDYSLIESKVELAICEYLNIEPPTEEEYLKVKRIDMTMLVIEMRDLTLHDYSSFVNEYTHTEMLEDEYFNIKTWKIKELIRHENDVRSALEFEYHDLTHNMASE